ncbi:MAG: PQQ-dependent sugar dehydrogenase [Chitinophagales bacterium]
MLKATAQTAILFFLFLPKIIFAQPSNNNCSGVITIPSNSCNGTTYNIQNATSANGAGSCGGATGSTTYDVWFQFQATSTSPTINLSNLGSNLSAATTYIEALSGAACAGFSVVGCNNASSGLSLSGLTIGTFYYIRIYVTSNPTGIPASKWNFQICVLDPPANDDCANATSLSSASSCSNTSGTLSGATASSPAVASTCAGTPGGDVWYSFVAQSVYPTISLSSIGTSFSTAGVKLQLLSGSCGSFTTVACVSGSTSSLTLNTMTTPGGAGLAPGTTYYIRVYSPTTNPSGANWTFNICVTISPSLSRMNEIFKPTILSGANVLNTAWEVTYGPDNYLWVTENKGYKAYRIDPVTGTKTTILDISQGSVTSELTSGEHTTFNVQFPSTQNPWPQGGFAGLAIHPQFNSGKPYVYISYVRTYTAGGSSGPGYFFTNSVVRFTYNTSTGKLETPVVLCDTLPGSSDHNSQRMIIAPVGGTYYLFYAQGDMGAGQLTNSSRVNKAQNFSSYEGKILRFNLEPDADAGAYDKWIPDDNPHNGATQSAIWCAGIRNNQGFAYDTANNILYGSSHGPYSDDEINIIQRDKNYGHPLVIGYAADGNYNSSDAGTPNNSPASSLAVITDEAAAAAAIPNYKDPLFCGYAPNQATLHNIWVNNPSNSTWPSEAWSGMDFYSSSFIPGWKNSLVLASLKWGRMLRLKLDAGDTTIAKTNGADTIAYFGGMNRYRDLAFSPDGKDIFVSMEGSTSAGPASNTTDQTVPACTNCLIKYTFLGYADASGKSSIPDAIDVTTGTANSCTSGTTVTIDNTNNNLWVPITGPDGNILAEIYPNGNNLGTVTSSFYTNSGAIRVKSGSHYLDRNITITPQNQPASTVKIRLYFSKAEFNALDADPLSGVSAINDVKIFKNTDACGSAMVSGTTMITPTFAEAHGTNGYILQGNISSFSTFYFSSSNIVLPLQLLSFTGSAQNNTALLKWVTTNEKNVSGFMIERSINGADFKNIGSATAKGNSNSTNEYSYIDYDAANQLSQVVYYRLKMVDVNGSFSYSQVVSVTFTSFYTLLVHPNPVQQILYVHSGKNIPKPLRLQLYDLNGRVLKNELSFLNDFSTDVSMLKSGLYILKLYNGYNTEMQIEKIIKQ